MNWLRVCFVLMLVVLLPLRGAVAAALLCPPVTAAHVAAVPGGATAQAAHSHPGAHQHEQHHGHAHNDGTINADDHALHAGLQAEHDPHGGAGHHDTSHGVQDGKCNLCAASCSLTTLLGDPPFVAEPPVAAAAAFPALSAPAPSFLSGGQDRPPRSI